MKMGSKENYSPTNFNTKDANLIGDSPMMMDEPKKQKKHESGVSYGYKEKEGGVRGGFNKAFARAKKGGYDDFQLWL